MLPLLAVPVALALVLVILLSMEKSGKAERACGL